MREKLVWSSYPGNAEFEAHLEDIVYSGETVLDVGCGTQKITNESSLPGITVIGVDAYADVSGEDIKALMWDMPFEDNSVDGLVCMAALEHISKFQVLPTLEEFNRVLKPEAKFAILVPNIIWIMTEFIRKPNVNWEMDLLFGIQTHEGEFHRTGFTEDIIRIYFQAAIPNCEIIKIYEVVAYSQLNFGIVAVKH